VRRRRSQGLSRGKRDRPLLAEEFCDGSLEEQGFINRGGSNIINPTQKTERRGTNSDLKRGGTNGRSFKTRAKCIHWGKQGPIAGRPQSASAQEQSSQKRERKAGLHSQFRRKKNFTLYFSASHSLKGYRAILEGKRDRARVNSRRMEEPSNSVAGRPRREGREIYGEK